MGDISLFYNTVLKSKADPDPRTRLKIRLKSKVVFGCLT